MEIAKRKRSVIAFTDALCRLVCDTPLKKITVTGICDEAGYTPMAFYSSFENKYDFVNSIVDYEAQVFAGCVFSRLEQKDLLSGGKKTGTDVHRLYMTDFLEHVAANRALYHCILNDLLVPDGIMLLSGRIAYHMQPYLTLEPDGQQEIPNFTDFILGITEAEMLMVVRYWLDKMPDTEPRAVADLYCDRFLYRKMVPLVWDPESGVFRARL